MRTNLKGTNKGTPEWFERTNPGRRGTNEVSYTELKSAETSNGMV